MDEEQIRGLASLGPLAIVRGVLTVSDQPGPGTVTTGPSPMQRR